MKFFYSGANNLDDPQTLPNKSLGGYRSSTVIPNGKVNSIFNDFSNYTIQNEVVETKAIFVKNTFDIKVTGVLIYALFPDNSKVLFQISAQSGSNIEKLNSTLDIPYYSEFLDLNVVFSKTDLNITENFSVNETVVIEGQSILVPDGTKQTFLTNAVKAFETNPQYKAIKIDDNTLRIEYRILGVFTNTPSITVVNPLAITGGNFGSGIDNSRLITNELNPGESIGIFIKRQPNNLYVEKTLEEYKQMYQEFKDNGFKKIQNNSLQSVKFCLEFTKS